MRLKARSWVARGRYRRVSGIDVAHGARCAWNSQAFAVWCTSECLSNLKCGCCAERRSGASKHECDETVHQAPALPHPPHSPVLKYTMTVLLCSLVQHCACPQRLQPAACELVAASLALCHHGHPPALGATQNPPHGASLYHPSYCCHHLHHLHHQPPLYHLQQRRYRPRHRQTWQQHLVLVKRLLLCCFQR